MEVTKEAFALRRDIYLLIASLMRSAPDQSQLDFLSQLVISDAQGEISSAWHQLQILATQCNAEQVAEEYQELFIGVGRGEVIPFASWHIVGVLMDKPLAQLRQTLKQLGFERNDAVHKEPEDHISALCEVMALLIDESMSDSDNNSDNEQETAMSQPAIIKQQQFFNQHISPWYESLITHIRQAASAHFYQAVAQLMGAFMAIEQARLLEKVTSSTN